MHGASLNIYTQVGLVTLIGLISKHGILIVEVANEEQRSGKSKRAAIVTAASIRLRPILMTTAAMVLGVMPLVFARGEGGASRYAIGLVISTGLAIGTLFTLFVVPAVYISSAPRTRTRSEPVRHNLPPETIDAAAVRAPLLIFNAYRFFARCFLEKWRLRTAAKHQQTWPVKTLTKSALRFVDCLVYSNRSMLI